MQERLTYSKVKKLVERRFTKNTSNLLPFTPIFAQPIELTREFFFMEF